MSLKHRALMLYSGLVRLLTAPALDEVPAFRRLRGFLYGLAMPRCGSNFQVHADTILWGLEHLSVGRDVYLGPGTTVICLDEVTLEDGVLFGPHAVVSNGNHVFRGGSFQVGENTTRPIRVGSGSWIGANTTLVAGAEVGRGCLVAANAVVTGPVEDFAIVGGVPARTLGSNLAGADSP